MKSFFPRFVLAAVALFLGACASTPPAPPLDPEQIVSQRADQRWQLLIERKPAEAYDFLAPGYRSRFTREQYAAMMLSRPVEWNAAEVADVRCREPEVCTARIAMLITTQTPKIGKMQTPAFVIERWLLLENQWFLVPRAD